MPNIKADSKPFRSMVKELAGAGKIMVREYLGARQSTALRYLRRWLCLESERSWSFGRGAQEDWSGETRQNPVPLFARYSTTSYHP